MINFGLDIQKSSKFLLYFRCRRPLRRRRRSFRPFHKRDVAIFTTTLFHSIFKFLLKIWFLIKGIAKSQLIQKKGWSLWKTLHYTLTKIMSAIYSDSQEVKIYFISRKILENIYDWLLRYRWRKSPRRWNSFRACCRFAFYSEFIFFTYALLSENHHLGTYI